MLSMCALLAGCAPPLGPGVTTGGTKDMAYARQTIEDGNIPDPAAITVEGFISEHDISISEPPNAPVLYDSVVTSWNQDFDALTPLATISIGFGTTVDAEHFAREPQNLCLVIDRSGSMTEPIDARTNTPKLSAVKIAVDRLLGQLDARDRVSIVSFADDVRVDLQPTVGTDIVAIKSALDTIQAEGGTSLYDGLNRAYRLIDVHPVEGLQERLLVFTDALPTAGPTEETDFLDLMNQFAAKDIGATVFGVGLDFGTELAQKIGQVRGGNFFYLSDLDRIVQVFDDEFDYLVSPIAYDIEVVTAVSYEWDVNDVYGIPGVDTTSHALTLDLPTLFFSPREGGAAIFIRLRAGVLVNLGQAQSPATVRLSYKTPSGATVTNTQTAQLPADLSPTAETSYFPNAAARRGVLLLNTALALKAAASDAYTAYSWEVGDYARAAQRLEDYLPYFDGLATGLVDHPTEQSRALSDERALLVKLLANINARR